MSLTDYVSRVDKVLPQADTELPAGAVEEMVYDAVMVYSRLRPRNDVEDYAGDGSTYDFTLPTNWVQGFSSILAVEWESVGEQEPVYLRADKWMFYLSPTGWKLRFFEIPDGTVRVTYTKPHTENTVYDQDKRAVGHLVIAKTALALAGKYSGYNEPSFEADVINYRTKADEYRSQARLFERLFKEHFGMGNRDIAPAAMGWEDLDLPRASLKSLPVNAIFHAR